MHASLANEENASVMDKDHVVIVQNPTWTASTVWCPSTLEVYLPPVRPDDLVPAQLAKHVGGERQNVMEGRLVGSAQQTESIV